MTLMTVADLEYFGVTRRMLIRVSSEPDQLPILVEMARDRWRDWARRHHPDLGGDVGIWIRGCTAYRTLQRADIDEIRSWVLTPEMIEQRRRVERMRRDIERLMTT